MPNLETPSELAEHLADQMGIYGSHVPRCGDISDLDDCPCRVCFVTSMTERIRQATINEHILSGAAARARDAGKGEGHG